MDMIKKIGNCIFNVFYYKVALMFFLIPTLLVYCVSISYKPMFFMLGWGAVICLYDLFARRNFVKARGMLWLIGFLAVFALAVILNFRIDFSLNFSSWAYTLITLYMLYPDCAIKDKETAIKELTIINNIFIGMTTVFSTISLGMFVCLYSKRIEFGDQKYSIGWDLNRLFGVYSNTGYMITAIGLAVIVIQAFLIKAKNGKISKAYKAFFIYTAIVNFFSMCMENAKGAFISLAGFVAVFTFFVVFRKMMKKDKKAILTYVVSTICAGLATVIMFGAIYITRPILSYVPVVYKNLTQTTTDTGTENKENSDKVNIDRDIPESYGFLTGRTIIWKFGVEEFLKKPIFGHGPQSHRAYFIVDNYLRHFHNLIVQTFVSVGTVGSIFIFGFFITIFVFLLSKLLKKAKEKDGGDSYYIAISIFSILIMFGINSMAEVTILFIAKFAMFIFWMYLGYIQAFVESDKKGKGTIFLENINEKVNTIFKKK